MPSRVRMGAGESPTLASFGFANLSEVAPRA